MTGIRHDEICISPVLFAVALTFFCTHSGDSFVSWIGGMGGEWRAGRLKDGILFSTTMISSEDKFT